MPLAGKGKGDIMSSQFQKNIAMPSHTILSIDLWFTMILPIKRAIIEQTGKVVVGKHTNQFN